MSTLTAGTISAEQRRSRASAVSLANVTKSFKLPHQRYHTIKERMLHPLRSRAFDILTAVNDVSADIAPGEFFGIIGRNGSGKSTLLKCIAGIYDIDVGEMQVRGRLSPFIELGVGFNLDLTARDNVLINAVMLGLTPKEARERFDAIIAFAELEDFLDLKLKNYSSGMSVRLAFSVAIQVDAEILLIDEVLAVGDAAFQKKCFNEFERLKREGRTVLFVSHDMGTVERFCDRAMLLEKGRRVAIGPPGEIARRYHELNFGRLAHQRNEDPSVSVPAAQIIDAWFEDETGSRIAAIGQGTPCVMCAEIAFNEDLLNPSFGFTLRNDVGSTIFSTTTGHEDVVTGAFRKGSTAVVRVPFENLLVPSDYNLTPSIALEADGRAIDVYENMASLQVASGSFTGGVVNLPHSFEVKRG